MGKLKLLLISREALERHTRGSRSEAVFGLLAALHRRGVPILLTAPAPDHWMPTVGDSDAALGMQQEIQQAAWEAGGEMDGVYYVPRSLLTQDRNRVGALRDILERYHVDAGDVALISNSSPFLKAADVVGIPNYWVPENPGKPAELIAAISDATGLET